MTLFVAKRALRDEYIDNTRVRKIFGVFEKDKFSRDFGNSDALVQSAGVFIRSPKIPPCLQCVQVDGSTGFVEASKSAQLATACFIRRPAYPFGLFRKDLIGNFIEALLRYLNKKVWISTTATFRPTSLLRDVSANVGSLRAASTQ